MQVRIVKCILLLILVFQDYRVEAQYNEMGIFLGGSNYKGELSRHLFNDDFIHPAIGLFYRHNWDRRWSWKLAMYYGKISGDDALAESPFELDRNLSFHSTILELSPQIEFNFFTFETGRADYPFTPFLFAGLSVFRFNPRAQIGNSEFDLQPLGTEGQGFNGKKKYKRLQMAIPFGGGIKISAGKFGIGIEVGARRTYSDYLDDVSTVYPDMAALGAINGPVAVALSDRSFSRFDTTASVTNFFRKQRGNSTDKDWYLFAGITIYWRLVSPLRDICEPFKFRRY